MKVELSLHGELKRHHNNHLCIDLEIADGSTIRQLIEKTNVPPEEIAFAAVSGSRVSTEYILHDGDKVRLFQYVAGG